MATPPIPVVKVLAERDFRAGLNLRADAFALAEGETPDVQNMDFDPRGGFSMRQAYAPFNTGALPASPHSMFDFATASGTQQLLVGANKHTYYSTGTDFTSIGTTWTSTNPQRAVTFNDLLYVQNGVDAPRKWTGSAASTLTQTFNDSISAPDNGDMPIAKCIAVHMGYVWVANTYESATNYRNRLRFSHPNKAEDWRTNDYIDIDIGHDGDEITALAPFGERLLIFKRNSVHALVGYSPDTFQVLPVSVNAGAVSQEAVVVTDYGAFFFNWYDGVHLFNGSEVKWQWERLVPAMWDGRIPNTYVGGTTLGWLNRRLYVSVPWESSTVNARTFVFDPTLGKQGGWTAYDNGFGPMFQWRRGTSTKLDLAALPSPRGRVVKLNQDADTDSYLSDYLTLTGSSGSYAWAPDSANTSPTGDLTIQGRFALDDWTPSATSVLIAKWETASNQRSWSLSVNTSGNLVLETSADGSTVLTHTSTAATSITDGTAKSIRVTIDVNNGAAGRDVKFYTSDDEVTWTQLGSTVTVGATTSIFNSTARVTVGARLNDGSGSRMTGKAYWAGFSADLTYTDVRANPNFTRQQPDVTSFQDTASTPATWTLAAALSGLGRDIDAYYVTRWFDADNASVLKRWRRPELVMDNDYDATVRIQVYKNYDPVNVQREFTVTTNPAEATEWGLFDWGEADWSAGASGAQQIAKGNSLGSGRSVQLKFIGPTPSMRWAVNSLNLKYVPRRVR